MHLPPRDLWPDRIYTLPELQYPDVINLAEELVSRQISEGRGDRAAILHRGGPVSYHALYDMVNRIAGGLRRQGVEHGDRVMLRMLNGPELAASWLAVQKIGAVAVSTMPMLKAREIAYVMDDAEAKVAIVGASLLEEVEHALGRVTARPRIIVAGTDGDPRAGARGHVTLDMVMACTDEAIDPYPTGRDDLAMIAYTSGSTGLPKGACHAPIDLLSSADTYARDVLRPQPEDVFGGHPTLAFTYGLGGLLIFPLRFGAATSLLERFTPDALMEQVERHRITILFCAATTYRLLLQIPDLTRRYDLSSLRLCISAGEPLPRHVAEEWMRATGVEVLDGLGTTEMFHIFISPAQGAVRAGSAGTAVRGYDVRILDDELREVPRGTPGLLAVRGPTGCRYWRKPDRQRDYVRGGWNIPNDVCVQDPDGYFWYQCRNDDLIICAGYNIAGPEVEAVLTEHPAVSEAAVIASPDPLRGHVPKAFIVLAPGFDASEALEVELQEHVKRELAPYKYPRRVAFVASLPRTETGKLKRGELRKLEAGNGGPGRAGSAGGAGK